MTFELYKVTKSWTQPNDNDDGPTMFNNWTKLADSYDPLVVDSVPYERLTIDWFTFDVKDAVQDFLENPSENHGLMLFTTGYVEPKRGGSLANINNPDDKDKNFRPKVTITYTTSTSINNNLNAPLKPVVISTLKDNLFQISSSMSFDADITINSINGSVVHRLGNQNIAVGNTVVPLKKRLKSGLYIVKVRGKGVSVNQKIFAIQ